mmetsp:Transcript_8846/g.12433  ORF Transcript_8846/g.12433 Transcript_8846/m.12433 type:complete len:242 (+) Transcript_8846:80-805(+)
MGMVIGKINEETPEYDSLGRVGDLEIRRYKPVYMAKVSSKDFPEINSSKEFQSAGFRTLAKYIGVFSDPQNVSADTETGEAIAMTAPVMMTSNETIDEEGEPIAMTAPVVMSGEGESLDWSMSFILPSKYIKSGKQPPCPTDKRVKIIRVDSRTMAVKRFSGIMTKSRSEEIAQEVVDIVKSQMTTRDIVTNDSGKPAWECMGYNPPFTLPCFRTNEVGVLVKDRAPAPPQNASAAPVSKA